MFRPSRSFKVPQVFGGQWKNHQTFQKWDPVSKRLVQVNCCYPSSSQPSPSPIVDSYDWLLIDNTNQVWVSDSDFSNLRTNGSTLPSPSNHWNPGNITKCLWTGTYWLFLNNQANTLLRSDITLNSWTTVSGISISSGNYDMATDGSNTVVINTSGFGKSYISFDGGATWNVKSPIASDDQAFYKSYYDGTAWIVSMATFSGPELSYIYRSTDNGNTFTSVYSTTVSPDDILCFCKTTSGQFYSTGRDRYWTSLDGITWSQFNMGTGITNSLIGEILHDGTKFVGIAPYNGPVWSNDGVNWTTWTSNDGSTLTGYDYDYNRLHFNGTVYSYRNPGDNKLYKSSDGKIWSSFLHPIAGRYFVDSYPKLQDVNLNIK